MPSVRACASVRASVALTAGKLEGYGQVHGHDVSVMACYCGAVGVDVERIAEAIELALGRVLGGLRGSLDGSLGEGSLIEDLLERLVEELPTSISRSRLCMLRAEWMWGERSVELLL